MRKWIVTLGGAGLVPFMPGTIGSLVAAGIALLVYTGLARVSSVPSAYTWPAVLLIGLAAASLLCVRLGPFAIEHFKREDPGPMVLDEMAGICLTLLFQPIAPGAGAVKTAAVAFCAFRFFDILKPPPARQLEHLPLGWGILLDDLAAAVYANLLCQVVLRYWLLTGVNHA